MWPLLKFQGPWLQPLGWLTDLRQKYHSAVFSTESPAYLEKILIFKSGFAAQLELGIIIILKGECPPIALIRHAYGQLRLTTRRSSLRNCLRNLGVPFNRATKVVCGPHQMRKASLSYSKIIFSRSS